MSRDNNTTRTITRRTSNRYTSGYPGTYRSSNTAAASTTTWRRFGW